MINEMNARMLKLLADVLHNNIPDKVAGDEWPDMFNELHAQMVYAIPAEYFSKLGLSSKYESEYLKAIVYNRKIFHKLMKQQEWALSLLKKANIPVVVLKGASAAINYNHPENRCMGDIDILVLPQDFDKAYDVLVGAGCKPLDSSDYLRHVGMFTENGIEIELHRFFSSSDNEKQNAILDEMLFKAIPSCISTNLCGYPVSMLPPIENGLVLLGHINQHLSNGLGLRQIIDWMEYVEKYLDDETWENDFAKKAELIGMKRLAMITTAMCQKYLGLDKDIHWCDYEPVCDELMEFILSQGNFGTKENFFNSRVTNILKKFYNPFYGLRAMQEYGLINWKATKKYPVLKPFAWCYQLIRWIKKGLKGGVSIELLDQASTSAKNNAKLMEKLGVTRL